MHNQSSPKLAFALGILVAALAALVLSLARDSRPSAQDSAPAPAVEMIPERIGFIDLGKVVKENKARERDGAKMRRELEVDFFATKASLDQQIAQINEELRQVRNGDEDWRGLLKRRYKVADTVITKEAELAREQEREIQRINARHYYEMMKVIDGLCKAKGITVLLNLYDTASSDQNSIDLAAKVFDDSVVWKRHSQLDITAEVVAEMARLDALNNPPEPGAGESGGAGKPPEGPGTPGGGEPEKKPGE